MLNMLDVYFAPVPTQGNIYTITDLEMMDHTKKVLFATSKGDFYLVDYSVSDNIIIPGTRKVAFTYIPNGAEIISIDAFNKSHTKSEFVIGITLAKYDVKRNTVEYYINIYSEWEESEEFHIDNISQNCLSIELNFRPYQLSHTFLVDAIKHDEDVYSTEIVFVLAGDDNELHLYREQAYDHCYKEIPIEDYFPECIKLPSPALSFDICYTHAFDKRITATASQCGYLRSTIICVKSSTVLNTFTMTTRNIISKLCFFRDHDAAQPDIEALITTKPCNQIKVTEDGENLIHLLAVNVSLPPIVFQDVLTYGLTDYEMLPRRGCCTVFSSCVVADVDLDGFKEVVVGTSSRELLVYKVLNDEWCHVGVRMLSSPVLDIRYCNMINDGGMSLVVFCQNGVTFLQYKPDYVDLVLVEKLKMSVSNDAQNEIISDTEEL